MTDEMPLDIRRQRRMFLSQFLLVALTEDTLSLGIGRLDILIGMILANGHQADPLWQLAQHLTKMTFYIIHGLTGAHRHP